MGTLGLASAALTPENARAARPVSSWSHCPSTTATPLGTYLGSRRSGGRLPVGFWIGMPPDDRRRGTISQTCSTQSPRAAHRPHHARCASVPGRRGGAEVSRYLIRVPERGTLCVKVPYCAELRHDNGIRMWRHRQLGYAWSEARESRAAVAARSGPGSRMRSALTNVGTVPGLVIALPGARSRR